jgi:hypothetical protein
MLMPWNLGEIYTLINPASLTFGINAGVYHGLANPKTIMGMMLASTAVY